MTLVNSGGYSDFDKVEKAFNHNCRILRKPCKKTYCDFHPSNDPSAVHQSSSSASFRDVDWHIFEENTKENLFPPTQGRYGGSEY